LSCCFGRLVEDISKKDAQNPIVLPPPHKLTRKVLSRVKAISFAPAGSAPSSAYSKPIDYTKTGRFSSCVEYFRDGHVEMLRTGTSVPSLLRESLHKSLPSSANFAAKVVAETCADVIHASEYHEPVGGAGGQGSSAIDKTRVLNISGPAGSIVQVICPAVPSRSDLNDRADNVSSLDSPYVDVGSVAELDANRTASVPADIGTTCDVAGDTEIVDILQPSAIATCHLANSSLVSEDISRLSIRQTSILAPSTSNKTLSQSRKERQSSKTLKKSLSTAGGSMTMSSKTSADPSNSGARNTQNCDVVPLPEHSEL
jgi:hypothetical protein